MTPITSLQDHHNEAHEERDHQHRCYWGSLDIDTLTNPKRHMIHTYGKSKHIRAIVGFGLRYMDHEEQCAAEKYKQQNLLQTKQNL